MVVKEVNSALSYMERMSYPTTQKSDDWDARCIASVLLRKLDTLPDANPQDLYWTIKMMVNRRNSIVKSITNLTNQLHENLNYNYPSYKKFFSDVNSKTALAFYEKYPLPKHLKGVTDEELAEFLRKPSHNSCSTRKAKEILDLVESDGDTTREYQDDLEAIAEYDPDNYEKYKKIAEVGAAADACTLGYVRGIINTPPTVAQLIPYYDNPEWTENWIDFVNENVNTRTIIEKTDEAFKDPVTGPKLKSFLRSDTLDQFKKKMKNDE
ncbi:transposase [Clostridium sp. ZBS18]|uniref:IS110 family transposase n=1 Tax=Clostridium sp. ZBS18 TaxID=2949967 RepID=UPI00030A5739|nr:transposase [Clostridium sp. ZBS18]